MVDIIMQIEATLKTVHMIRGRLWKQALAKAKGNEELAVDYYCNQMEKDTASIVKNIRIPIIK